jgi:hypothetical protein
MSHLESMTTPGPDPTARLDYHAIEAKTLHVEEPMNRSTLIILLLSTGAVATAVELGSPATVNGDPGGAGVLRVNGGITASQASGAFGVILGDTVLPGLGAPGTGPWYPGTTVIGSSGTDKLVLGYLKSSTNRASIGSHSSGLNAWAPLSLAGSVIEFRAYETVAASIAGDQTFIVGADPGTASGVAAKIRGADGITIGSTAAQVSLHASGTNNALQFNNGASIRYTLGSSVGLQALGDYLSFNRFDGTTWAELGRFTASGLSSNGTITAVLPAGGTAQQWAFGTAGTWLASNSFYPGKGQSAGALCLGSTDATTGQDLLFSTFNGPSGYTMTMKANGNVGIGTTTPTNKLTVIGTISAQEIKVTSTGADYVFEDGYRLRPLAEVEAFVVREKHLPEMMPAKRMQAEGMPVSEVVTKQLAKIEELTLYVIELDRERRDQAERLAAMTRKMEAVSVANARMAEQLAAVLARLDQVEFAK